MSYVRASLIGATLLSLMWAAGCSGRTSPEPTSEEDAAVGQRQADAGHGLGSQADAAAPQFPVGVYQCSSALQEYHTGAGGNGTLTLHQTGDVVTATYTGDYAAAGTLDLVVTTDGSANPATGQTFQTLPCGIPSGSALDTEDVTAGSLTLDGASLFLEVIGTASSDPSCDGSPAYLTLTCEKGDAG